MSSSNKPASADDIQAISLKNGHYVVINTLSGGDITVLNREAYKLFCLKNQRDRRKEARYGETKDDPNSRALEKMRSVGLINTLENSKPHFQDAEVLGVWMHITNACNLRCTYCYIHKNKSQMSWKIAKDSVDSVFRSAHTQGFKKVKFKLSGGEATLRESFLTKLILYIRAQQLSTNIDTSIVILSNGVAISDSMIRLLKDYGVRLMISLDGIGKYHDRQRVFANGSGSFQHIQKTLLKLQKAGIDPSISITITNESVRGLPNLTRFLLKRKLYNFSFNLYRENDCSKSNENLSLQTETIIKYIKKAYAVIEEYLPLRPYIGTLGDRTNLMFPHEYTCAAGRNYLVIDSSGNVSKCQMEMGIKVTSIYAKDPIKDIRTSPEGIQALKVDEKVKCRSCMWKYFCCGGCPLLTHSTSGSYAAPSPNCDIYQAILPELVRLEGLRILKYANKDNK